MTTQMGPYSTRREFIRTGTLSALGLAAAPWELFASRGSAPAVVPLRGGDAPKRIVVVGAGLAGLSAAYELVRAGHDVTVLEANLRPGGRVLTLRAPFSDGLYAEAGAMLVPDTHDLTLGYVRTFDLPFDPPPAAGLRWVEHLRGSRIVYDHDGDTPAHPFALTPEEEALGHWGLHERAQPPDVLDELGDIARPDWRPSSFPQYDRITYAEYLRRLGFSSEAIALLAASFHWGDGPDTVSALAVLRDAVHQRGATRWYSLRGGNDLLARAFAARLEGRIRYGAPVERIEWSDGGARATWGNGWSRDSATGDYLVCAIPFSVLRDVEIDPPFSPGKARAIRELPYFSATRVSLQCTTRFWEAEGLAGEGLSDLAIGSFLHATAVQPGSRGILQCYSSGPHARRIAAMPETDRIEFALEQMERVFPGTRKHFERGVSTCWDEEPWARGASSWYAPEQMSELAPHVAAPEGRVHFAGDHTSPYIRWMQGALHSGIRVTQEIHSSCTC